jgi:hypothetical protein
MTLLTWIFIWIGTVILFEWLGEVTERFLRKRRGLRTPYKTSLKKQVIHKREGKI